MNLFVLFAAKLMICMTILVYSSLLGENTILAQVFTKPLAMYHGRSFWYILKTASCAVITIGYNLHIHLPARITFIGAAEVFAVQFMFFAIGWSFLRQSVARTYIVSQMKQQLAHLKLVEQHHQRQPHSLPKHRQAIHVSAGGAH